MSVARFSWVPNLYNLHFLLENHRPQPDPVNSYRDVFLVAHIIKDFLCILTGIIQNKCYSWYIGLLLMAHPLGDPKIKTEWMNLFVVVCLGNTTDQKQTWFIFCFSSGFCCVNIFWVRCVSLSQRRNQILELIFSSNSSILFATWCPIDDIYHRPNNEQSYGTA